MFYLRNMFGDLTHNFNGEQAEQGYTYAYMPRDSVVLSIGGNIGRNCIFVDRIIAHRSQHLCVEPDPRNFAALQRNKEETQSMFENLNGVLARPALGNVSIVSRGIASNIVYNRTGDDVHSVPTIDIDLSNFTAVLVDCEGCYCKLIKSFPELLNAYYLQFELDSGPCDYDLENLLSQYGYIKVDGSLMTWGDPPSLHAVYTKHTFWMPLFANFVISHMFELFGDFAHQVFPSISPQIRLLSMWVVITFIAAASLALLVLLAQLARVSMCVNANALKLGQQMGTIVRPSKVK